MKEIINKGFIPQIAYDIIARIIPGFITIVIIFIPFSIPWDAFKSLLKHGSLIFSFSGIVVILIISYSITIIISGYSLLLVRVYFGIRKLFGFNDENIFPDLHKKLGQIRIESPDTGYRIIKLRAEWHMAKSLIWGWFLAIICCVYIYISYPQHKSLMLKIAIIYLLCMFGTEIFRRFLKAAYIDSIRGTWENLGLKKIIESPKMTEKSEY